jgi:dCMP deaminase
MSLLEQTIQNVNNLSERIKWSEYFMSLAFLISSRSSCHRLRVGCVLVSDTRVISVGYNGFLPGAPHTSIVRDNHEQATVHAEQNCISDCAKRGISCKNSTAYITHYPCINCAKILASAQIKEIIYYEDYKNDELVCDILKNSNIIINKFNTIKT